MPTLSNTLTLTVLALRIHGQWWQSVQCKLALEGGANAVMHLLVSADRDPSRERALFLLLLLVGEVDILESNSILTCRPSSSLSSNLDTMHLVSSPRSLSAPPPTPSLRELSVLERAAAMAWFFLSVSSRSVKLSEALFSAGVAGKLLYCRMRNNRPFLLGGAWASCGLLPSSELILSTRTNFGMLLFRNGRRLLLIFRAVSKTLQFSSSELPPVR